MSDLLPLANVSTRDDFQRDQPDYRIEAMVTLRQVWVGPYPRLTFAHRAFCAAAIFLFTVALILRFLPEVAPSVTAPSRSLQSSLFGPSSFSLIAAARLSCWGVSSVMFMSRVERFAIRDQAMPYQSRI